MGAVASARDGSVDVAGILAPGIDLFLTTPDPAARARIEDALVRECDRTRRGGARARVRELRSWLRSQGPAPDLTAVRSPLAHRALARELAERALTLVRDDTGVLPLRLPSDATILAVMPVPTDLTPADTSSAVTPGWPPRSARPCPGR